MPGGVARADARALPLADGSVNLVVTSPPYFGQRRYGCPGEIGGETDAASYLRELWACTAEMLRVLAPGGSLWVNLGDKMVADNRGSNPDRLRPGKHAPPGPAGFGGRDMGRKGTRLLLPHRYAIGCMDQLGLIVRTEAVWAKADALTDNAPDRFQHTHEYLFHLTRERSYYHDMDQVRVPYLQPDRVRADVFGGRSSALGVRHAGAGVYTGPVNALGKLPGSVWQVNATPLNPPPYTALWAGGGMDWLGEDDAWAWCRFTGVWASRLPRDDTRLELRATSSHHAAFPFGLVRPLVLAFCPPGGVVLDPFGGTGTTALVADVLGRRGLSFDASGDYGWLARWRLQDPKERAKAAEQPPPPKPKVAAWTMESMF